MKLKKILAATITAVMTLGLVSCGGATGTDSSSSAGSASSDGHGMIHLILKQPIWLKKDI